MTQDTPKPGGRHGEIQFRDLTPQRVEDVGRHGARRWPWHGVIKQVGADHVVTGLDMAGARSEGPDTPLGVG